MTDSQKLLADYVGTGSEPAFRELLTRYIDLVYAASVRLVGGDTHLAQDVTQTVFADLAKKAGTLPKEVMLGGWLHHHTVFIASTIMRGERRRQNRERQALEMNTQQDHSGANLAQIAPVLDEAIDQLGTEDRTAILLRFFERLDFRSVGQALGSTEEAARKRVVRALEKLHSILKHRGVTLSAAALGAALATEVVAAAPAGLALSVATFSLAGTVPTSTTTLGVVRTIFMTKLKAGLVCAVVALATTSVVQLASLRQLRAQNQGLLDQASKTYLADPNLRTATPASDQAELERLRQGESDLLRLRGEVARLRLEAAKAAALETELAKLRKAIAEEVPSGASKLIINNPYLARSAWSDKGTDTPYHAFETMLWAGINGDTQRLGEVTIQGEHVSLKDRPPLMKIKGVQMVSVEGYPSGLTRVGAIVEEEFYGGGLNAPPGTVQRIDSWNIIQTNGEWKVTAQNVHW
jgi:RNA polymerase sigma factor (sigma-70 family)